MPFWPITLPTTIIVRKAYAITLNQVHSKLVFRKRKNTSIESICSEVNCKYYFCAHLVIRFCTGNKALLFQKAYFIAHFPLKLKVQLLEISTFENGTQL